jgi:hypothetical protein
VTITPPSVNSKLIFKLEHYRISLPLTPYFAALLEYASLRGSQTLSNCLCSVLGFMREHVGRSSCSASTTLTLPYSLQPLFLIEPCFGFN